MSGLKKYKAYLLTVILFFLLSAFIGSNGDAVNNILSYLYSSMLLLSLILFCLNFRRGKVFILIVLGAISIEVAYRIYFNERISLAALKSISDTDIYEVLSLIHIIIVLVAFAVIIGGLLTYSIYKIQDQLSHKLINRMLIALTFLITGILLFEPINNDPLFVKNNPESLGEHYYRYNNMLFSSALVITTSKLTNILNSVDQEGKAQPTFIEKLSKHKKDEVMVLVVGESSLVKRYNLYGYEHPTTPRLNTLDKNKKICAIKDVHSPSPITRDSVSMLLSFLTPEDATPLFEEQSIIELAKKAGWDPYWVTSQRLDNLHDTKYGFIANLSKDIKFTQRDDNNLSVQLNAILKDKKTRQGKKLIILHMAGSHMPYEDKFDAEDKQALEQFTPDLYDYSIHKTDRVLDKVHRVLASLEVDYTWLYLSDHGEIVNTGHGMLEGGPDQYLIPLILGSNHKRQEKCEQIEAFRHDNGYINSLMMRYFILEQMGYGLEQNYLKKMRDSDLVLHSDGQSYTWPEVP